MKLELIEYLGEFIEDVRRKSSNYEGNCATIEHLIDCFRSYLEELKVYSNEREIKELNNLMVEATSRLKSCPIRQY